MKKIDWKNLLVAFALTAIGSFFFFLASNQATIAKTPDYTYLALSTLGLIVYIMVIFNSVPTVSKHVPPGPKRKFSSVMGVLSGAIITILMVSFLANQSPLSIFSFLFAWPKITLAIYLSAIFYTLYCLFFIWSKRVAKNFVVLNGRIIKKGETFWLRPFVKNDLESFSPDVEIEKYLIECADYMVIARVKTSVILNEFGIPRDYKLFRRAAEKFIRNVLDEKAKANKLVDFFNKVLTAEDLVDDFGLEWNGKAEYTIKIQ